MRIDCSLCGEQIFDLHLCLSASVNVRYTLHTQSLALYNKILGGYLFVHYYFSSPPPFLLISSIFQMINTRNRNANAENNNAANPPTTLEQVLMMQFKCFKLCSKPWSTCIMFNTKHRHNHQETNLETFNTPSRLLSLTLSS
jgi:hypothetical protein